MDRGSGLFYPMAGAAFVCVGHWCWGEMTEQLKLVSDIRVTSKDSFLY